MGLFSAATYTNVDANAVTLDVAGSFPCTISWKYETAGQELPKQDDSGQHEASAFVRRLLVTVRGQILGDTEALYWTNRATFAKAFLVADGAQSSYHHGVLSVTPTGGAAMYLNCVLLSLDMPIDLDAPKASTYVAELRANRGYWRAVSGDAIVRL